MHNGPSIKTKRYNSCEGCAHWETKKMYDRDGGSIAACNKAQRLIAGGAHGDTPDWCPLKDNAAVYR